MSECTVIEWADHTFNPWWGCQKISPACEHCYAETFARRLGHGTTKPAIWGPPDHTERRYFGDQHWQEPLRWNARAERDGVRRRVFCASMADVFEAGTIAQDVERRRLWDLIRDTPWLDWLLLTKRPHLIMNRVPDAWKHGWPSNIWIGTTVENQQAARDRIPYLLQVPAAVRFLSCEPLLGPVNVSRWLTGPRWHCAGCGDAFVLVDEDGCCVDCGADSIVDDDAHGIDWVIVGGESGPKARIMHPEWARGLRDQCQAAGMPFFFNQWGSRHPTLSGRQLDGRTWDQYPKLVPVESPRPNSVPDSRSYHRGLSRN